MTKHQCSNYRELRQSLTDAEFTLHLYKLSITDLKDLLDDFESYGLLDDCSTMFKILNEINQCNSYRLMEEPKHYDNSKVHYINFVTITTLIHTDLTLLKE
jgi:hypothetical protein